MAAIVRQTKLVSQINKSNYKILTNTSFCSTTIKCDLTEPPDPRKSQYDFIGVPDKLSNLRPVIRSIRPNESKLEKQLRETQDTVQQWNQEFWTRHNTNFLKQREAFISTNLPKDSSVKTLSADKMSVFYKAFLDENWKLHLNYNIQWYSKNIKLLFLATGVNIERLFKKYK